MQQKTDKDAAQREALEQSEKVKEQYRRYLEISQIYSLPVAQPEPPELQYVPPSPDNPLGGSNIKVGRLYKLPGLQLEPFAPQHAPSPDNPLGGSSIKMEHA